MNAAPNRDVRVVERIRTLLDELSERKSCSLSELSEASGLAVSTTSRLLDSLEHNGFVERDAATKRYHVGRGLFRLVAASKPRRDVVSVIRPVLEWLVQQTGEDCGLAELQGTHATIIDLIDGVYPLKIVDAIRGGPEPLNCGAFRKVLLAYQEDSWIAAYINELTFQKFTPTTITSSSQLWTEIRRIRKHGYATSFGERLRDAGGIAVPVLDYTGKIKVTIQIVAPVTRLSDPRTLKRYINAIGHARDRATALLSGPSLSLAQRPKPVTQSKSTKRAFKDGKTTSAH